MPLKIKFTVLLAMVLLGLLGFQNFRANALLQAARRLDNGGHYAAAGDKLKAGNRLGVWPGITHQINLERQRNQQLQTTAQKLAEVTKLLHEHKTQAAQELLKSIAGGSAGSAALNAQTTQLQQAVNQSMAANTKSTSNSSGSSTTKSGSGGGTTGGGGGGNTGGTGGGNGGGTNPPPPPPPPPGPMSAISITSFTPSVSPRNASSCQLYLSATFSVNGSGSVQVTWEILSAKTSSAILNPVTYSFSAAGSQTDTPGYDTLQGLESGDSYRISVTIVDTNDNSVTASSSPAVFGTCAAPPPLQTASQPSFMASAVIPTGLTDSQVRDSIFPNECNMSLRASFSVSGPGSVQVSYVITSGSSIGATLYAAQQWSFTGPGSATDSSSIRMPHLPGGGYTITATFNVLGDPSHSATTGPITSACS